MRIIAPLLICAALAGCSTAVEPPMRSSMQQHDLDKLLAGKVAGAPVNCLQPYNSGDMRVIDENTVVYRAGSNRVYVSHFDGGCNQLGRPGYALLTKPIGSSSMCRGDIAQVIDVQNGITVGSCVVGDFTPYISQ